MTEPLFGVRPSMTGRLRFDLPIQGPDVSVRDHERLTGLLGRVETLMLDGQERTLPEIAQSVNGMEASVSARLRQLRTKGYTVNRRRDELAPGLFWYSVQRPESKWRSA